MTNEPRIPPGMIDRFLEDNDQPIRLWREHRGRSLFGVAAAVGIEPSELSDYEAGIAKPSPDLAASLAGELGIRVVDVLYDPEDSTGD